KMRENAMVLQARELASRQSTPSWLEVNREAFRARLTALLTMNVVSAWNILTVLNPRYAPGWEVFHFPP
ncbi:MAG: hypothetical protein ACE5JM_03845, partial [Armatimonadota bacterium]